MSNNVEQLCVFYMGPPFDVDDYPVRHSSHTIIMAIENAVARLLSMSRTDFEDACISGVPADCTSILRAMSFDCVDVFDAELARVYSLSGRARTTLAERCFEAKCMFRGFTLVWVPAWNVAS